MVEEQEESQWSKYAEAAIEKLDPAILKKYKLSLRDMLTNPREYAEKPGMSDAVSNIKRDVDEYYNGIKAEYAQEEASLNSELKRIDDIYKKVNSLVEKKTEELNVPYINPIGVSRQTNSDEVIIIYEYADSLDHLLDKLVPTSVYVADLSTVYEDYSIGYWLFSGSRVRALSVNPPASPLIDIEASHDEINSALDSVTALF